MSDADTEIEAEIVQGFSLAESRRHMAFEFAVPYIVGGAETSIPVREVLQFCAQVERWFMDGTIPEDPKSKFKVVGKPDATG